MKADADFFRGLSGSQLPVCVVGSYLASRGFDCSVKPVLLSPDCESRHEYVDSGDIEVRFRVEVKRRSFVFTGLDDYPYPTVLVDEKHKIDRIPPNRLYGYAVVDKGIGSLCFVSGGTKGQWKVERHYDRSEGGEREFYACPKELCVWKDMR